MATRVIEEMSALWLELKERREIVLKHIDLTTSNLAKKIYVIMANEQATIMDTLYKIITNAIKENNSSIPGNIDGLPGRSLDSDVVTGA